MKARWVGELRPDIAVKGVARLRAEDGVKKLLVDLAPHLAAPPKEITVEVIKQRIGQRAMLRLDAGKAGRFYLKLIRGSGGLGRAVLMNGIASASRDLGVRVPSVVTWLPRFRALVVLPVEGEPLVSCGALRAYADAGRALGRLHASLPRFAAIRDRAFERERIEVAFALLRTIRPELERQLRPVLDHELRIGTGSASHNGKSRTVPLHGDFYADQILWSASDGIGILDWDNACLGEAERDVGNFIAHVGLESARGAFDAKAADARIRVFREGYRSVREFRPGVLDWYVRASLVRIAALHADPAFGRCPPNRPELPERILASLGTAGSSGAAGA